jgi:hypothetical protein
MINIIAATTIITAKSCTIKLDGEREGDKSGLGKNCGKEEELATSGGACSIKVD